MIFRAVYLEEGTATNQARLDYAAERLRLFFVASPAPGKNWWSPGTPGAKTPARKPARLHCPCKNWRKNGGTPECLCLTISNSAHQPARLHRLPAPL
jgi:hypothetical protein